MTKKLIAGSRRFFEESQLNKKEKTDFDFVVLTSETDSIMSQSYLHENKIKYDLFIYDSRITKERLIHWHLHENNDPMNVCSLIVPEVLEHYNIDVLEIKDVFQKAKRLCKKKYAILIYYYYLINKAPVLTKEQLKEVHKVYSGQTDIKEYDIDFDKAIQTNIAEGDS